MWKLILLIWQIFTEYVLLQVTVRGTGDTAIKKKKKAGQFSALEEVLFYQM